MSALTEVDHALAQALLAQRPPRGSPDRRSSTKPPNSASNACTGSMIFGSGTPPAPYDSGARRCGAVGRPRQRDAGDARALAQPLLTARN